MVLPLIAGAALRAGGTRLLAGQATKMGLGRLAGSIGGRTLSGGGLKAALGRELTGAAAEMAFGSIVDNVASALSGPTANGSRGGATENAVGSTGFAKTAGQLAGGIAAALRNEAGAVQQLGQNAERNMGGAKRRAPSTAPSAGMKR